MHSIPGPSGYVLVPLREGADSTLYRFIAWNAVANLADLAGKVNVTVRADSAEGFDMAC
jgi:hypothetical protein